MIAKQTLFFTGDRKRVVPEGHPEAKFLFVREGTEVADAEVEKYGAASLVDSPPKNKPAEPQQQEPPNLKKQDAPPAPDAAAAAAPVEGKTEKPKKARKNAKKK